MDSTLFLGRPWWRRGASIAVVAVAHLLAVLLTLVVGHTRRLDGELSKTMDVVLLQATQRMPPPRPITLSPPPLPALPPPELPPAPQAIQQTPVTPPLMLLDTQAPAAVLLPAERFVLPAELIPGLMRLPSVVDLQSCRPSYPAESRAHNESGRVELQLVIAADNSLLRASVTGSSGFERLDAAALDGISRCRFSAALTQDGVAVQSSFGLEYVWRLDDPEEARSPPPM